MPPKKAVQDQELEQKGADDAPETAVETDADDEEYASALAAIEAEEKAAAKPEEDEGEGEEPETKSEEKGEGEEEEEDEPDQDKGEEDEQKSTASPMIPKIRFDEKIAALADLEAKNSFLQAKLDAFEKMLADPKATEKQKDAAAQEVTEAAQESREAIQERVLKAAEQYDENELTLAQFKRIEMEADAQISKMDRDGLIKELSSTTQKKPDMDLYTRQTIAMIEQRHPYVKVITDKWRWDMLFNEAASKLVQEGYELLENDPESDMLIRKGAAELSDVYGPMWYPDAKVEKPQTGTAQSTTSGTKPKPSMAADRAKKLELASKHPPDTAQLGRTGDSSDIPSEASIMSMTDEELENLPEATRRKLATL